MTTERERALLDMGFMPDASNDNVLSSMRHDMEHMARMARFLKNFPEAQESKLDGVRIPVIRL